MGVINKPIIRISDVQDEDIRVANFRKSGVSNTTYYLAIDVSNTSGDYRHPDGSSLHIIGINATLIKSDIRDQWIAFTGVITSVNETEATVKWIRNLGTIGLRDTGKIQDIVNINYLPFAIDLTVDAGELTKIASNFTENISALKSSNPIEDISGNVTSVEPGDLVIKLEKISGSGTAIIHYNYTYKVR